MEGGVLSVKRSQSGSRVLNVLETISVHQPIGVRALGRLLEEDKSAIQRALMTLADDGWIRPTREPQIRWELTARILTVANNAQGNNDLRKRARPMLERLRDECGETVLLVLPDLQQFVIADVIESRQVLRMVPELGYPVAARNTSTGRAMLPHLDKPRWLALLGSEPDAAMLASFEATRRLGYAISDGEINPAASSIASAILERDGSAIGAVVVTAPKERIDASALASIGKLVALTARDLSRSE